MYKSYIILLLNIAYAFFLQSLYPLNQTLHNLWYLIFLIFGIIYIHANFKKPIIDDGSFKKPPKYLKKIKNITFYIIFILISYNILIEIPNIKTIPKIQLIALLSRIILLVIFIYLYIKKKGYSTCKYKIPESWN